MEEKVRSRMNESDETVERDMVKESIRVVLQDVAAQLQGRLRQYGDLTYGDVSDVCSDVAKKHGTGVYV
jgi:hypothetical protein